MRDFLHDVRFGARMLRKSPGITLTALATLGLGIGANSAMFTLCNAVLLRPLPYPEPSRLVFVSEKPPRGGRNAVSAANFLDWQSQNRVFAGLTAVASSGMVLTGPGQPERIAVGTVSASFFTVLGVEPALGRSFSPQEDHPGAERVVVLSHGLWQRRFGGDPRVLGRAIALDGQDYTVIGVLSPRFHFYQRFDALMPIALDAPRAARDFHYLSALARLKPGVSLEEARAEMDGIARNIELAWPKSNQGWGVAIDSMHERLARGPREDLPVILGAAAFVLLIACANVANLLLARGMGRRREVAIRTALGAGRARILRQLLTESVLLAIMAGALGLLCAVWFTRVLNPLLPPGSIPDGEPLSVDIPVLLYTLVLSLTVGIVFGFAPAWRGSRFGLVEELKPGARGSLGHRSGAWLRGALVVCEIALSLVLLSGAGLMLRSLLLMAQARPGFDPDNLVTLRLDLPGPRYPSAERVRAFYDRAAENVRGLPGVRSAAISTSIPLRGWSFGMPFEIEGRPPVAAAARPSAHFVMVSEHYLPTLGIELKRGRGLTSQDDARSDRVAVVNEVFVRRFLAGEEPLGKHVRIESILAGRRELGPPVNWRIVGVCGSVRASALADLDSDASPEIYVPFAQSAWQSAYLTVRTTSDRLNLGDSIRGAIQAEDKDLPVADLRTMAQIRYDSTRIPRILTGFIATFGALALGLAAIGIWSLISYSVSQRTPELGVRAALGAQRRQLVALVMRQGGKLALIGLGVGLAASLALGRLLRNMLFGIRPHDPPTLATVTLVLAAVALLATWLPARRSARIDPSVALRND